MEGEVEIGIDGESVTLRPSLGAAMALNQEFGSFGGLLSELEAYNLGAAIKVVKRAGEFHDEERIFKTGLVEITPSLIRFVIMLANGGKPLAESGRIRATALSADHPRRALPRPPQAGDRLARVVGSRRAERLHYVDRAGPRGARRASPHAVRRRERDA